MTQENDADLVEESINADAPATPEAEAPSGDDNVVDIAENISADANDREETFADHAEVGEDHELAEEALRAAEHATASSEDNVATMAASPEEAQAQFAELAGSIATGEGAADLALSSLCQSYAHALSLAFHDAVLNQQRRSALGQAAVARAAETIQDAKPEDFETQLSQLVKGLDALGVSASREMETFMGLSKQFSIATEQLMQVRQMTEASTNTSDAVAAE
ncbi:RebB family R body protein [Kordiimonas laminariae]|uniref:RebB family R body protein n=1 Tax=Kordiimonas laminariae TaxID=2917717 RepID=UPI001FF19CEB|nr:RebB family R body protein [Kordiimonas laminariae]MCK0069634.1 RebB family R body protein [Kordiimonas laminariae]